MIPENLQLPQHRDSTVLFKKVSYSLTETGIGSFSTIYLNLRLFSIYYLYFKFDKVYNI
jgi:hypothetical protein